MAIVNGSITIRGTSTVTAKSKQIWAGHTTIRGTSSLTAKGNGILAGSMNIKGSSKVSIFWLKMGARSTVTIGTPIIQRLGKVTMGGISNLTADLIKAAKAFIRSILIEGDVITNTTLEGGGSEYMKTNQDFQLASGDYFDIDINVLDEQGNPKDISGFTFQWTMGGVVKTVLDGIQITDAINGKLTISLLTNDTSNAYGSYPHKLIMTDIQGHGTTILKGTAKIL
jgi:hypothetical protein